MTDTRAYDSVPWTFIKEGGVLDQAAAVRARSAIMLVPGMEYCLEDGEAESLALVFHKAESGNLEEVTAVLIEDRIEGCFELFVYDDDELFGTVDAVAAFHAGSIREAAKAASEEIAGAVRKKEERIAAFRSRYFQG